MLSKLLTITALSSGYVQAQTDRITDFYANFVCNIGNQPTSTAALNEFLALADEIMDHNNWQHMHGSVSLPDEDNVWANAKDECARLTALPDCSGDEADAPGSNCRSVNVGLTSMIHGGYGCWGNFPPVASLGAAAAAGNIGTAYGQMIELGRGQPKDELDGYARDLVQSYKCIMEEYMLEQNQACAPWEEQYSVTAVQTTDTSGLSQIQASCDSLISTHSSCAVKACYVEMLFVARYSVWTLNQPNPVPNTQDYYWHSTSLHSTIFFYNGPVGTQFENTAANCPTHGPVTHIYCCGEYPFRQRLHDTVSTTQCCNSVEYDDSTHECCGDPQYFGGALGSIATTGNC